MPDESAASSTGMKDLVQKTIEQLIELVVLLPAGGILLASILVLWLDESAAPASVSWLIADSTTALVVMLVAASALGLLMFGWASEGADAYLAYAVRRPLPHRWRWRLPQVRPLRLLPLRLLHWMPVPPALGTPGVEGALQGIADDYTTVRAFDWQRPVFDSPGEMSRPDDVGRRLEPWRSIARFTVLVDDLRPRSVTLRPSEGVPHSTVWGDPRYFEPQTQTDAPPQEWRPGARPHYVWSITAELQTLHLRVVLTLSVALALALTTIQAALRLGLSTTDVLLLPAASAPSLTAIGVACAVASIGLRFLAGRLWREELELALLLYERITRDAVLSGMARKES